MMNVIVPKLEYAGEVWEGNAKLVKKLEIKHKTSGLPLHGVTVSGHSRQEDTTCGGIHNHLEQIN